MEIIGVIVFVVLLAKFIRVCYLIVVTDGGRVRLDHPKAHHVIELSDELAGKKAVRETQKQLGTSRPDFRYSNDPLTEVELQELEKAFQ
jgi:hypothetical protein